MLHAHGEEQVLMKAMMHVSPKPYHLRDIRGLKKAHHLILHIQSVLQPICGIISEFLLFFFAVREVLSAMTRFL